MQVVFYLDCALLPEGWRLSWGRDGREEPEGPWGRSVLRGAKLEDQGKVGGQNRERRATECRHGRA